MVALATASGACGGSDEAARISRDISDAWTSNDLASCKEHTTTAFNRAFYGGGRDAVRRCMSMPDAETPMSVEVSNVHIADDHGSVEVTVTGGSGPAAGQTLKHTVVKRHGKWSRHVPLSVVHFDRHAFLRAARKASRGSENLSSEQRRCVLRELAESSDLQLQRFGRLTTPVEDADLARLLAPCVGGREVRTETTSTLDQRPQP